MADIDDFEIIGEPVLLNDQTFELIDVNDISERITIISNPTTPDVVLPFLIAKPLVDDSPPVVQQQTSNSIFIAPHLEEPRSPIITAAPIVSFLQVEKLTRPPPKRVFAPVPPLPKAPTPQRYGGAALIPHNLNDTLNVDDVIDKSKRNQQNTLNASIQQQQQRDIQTVLEQRRNFLNPK
jgi:hypothetical protein